jgi:hypothetical protein
MEYQDIFSPKTLEKLNKKSAEALKTMLGNKTLMQTLISSQDLLNQIAEAEAPYKSQLEELAVKMMKELHPTIDEEGIIIDAKLDDISGVNQSLDEILTPEGRRRLMNSISHGASMTVAFAFHLFKEYLDELDPKLVDLYDKIMKNSFGIYHNPDAIAMMLAQLSQGHKTAGGSSKVIIKEVKNSNITIKARAICFPMLIHEIEKGLQELISLSGFKGDKAANQAVVNKVDTLANEPYDIKYGQIIYEALNDLFIDSPYSDDSRLREYFLQDIYQLEDDEFLSLVENSINEEVTPRQRKWVDDTLQNIKDDLKSDDFYATGLDENKEFDFKKYLAEGRLLKEIEVRMKSSYNKFYEAFMDNEIEVHKDVVQYGLTDITIEELEDKKNNIPFLPDLESLAQAILDIDDMMTEDGGEYAGAYNAELLNGLQKLGDSTGFSEIDKLLSLVKLPDEDED